MYIKSRHKVKNEEFTPSDDTLAKTFWILQRHTSVTYISRLTEMLEKFTEGFGIYVSKYEDDPGTDLQILHGLKCDIADLREGLARLRMANYTGFKLIRDGFSFYNRFIRAADGGFGAFGYQGQGKPGIAMWAWMEKILPMVVDISSAIHGRLAYPFLDFDSRKYFMPPNYLYPKQIGGFPFGEKTFIQSGDDIPTTGVWQPIKLGNACPNYLIQGNKAPMVRIPTIREDKSAWVERQGKKGTDSYREIHHAERIGSSYDFAEVPAQWQLMWEDDRWRNGREPLGEYEYLLDPKTDLPTEPALPIRYPVKNP